MARFRSAFQHAAIGKAIVCPRGDFLEVNPALCTLLGYSETELLQKTFADITHPDDLDADLAYVRQMLAREIESYRMEKRYLHREGHVVWSLLNVSAVYDEQGAVKYLIGEIQNITERKRALRQLRRAEAKFRALVEQSLVGVYVIQEDRYTYVNEALASIVGRQPDELIGANPLDFILEEDHELVRTHIRRRLDGEVDSARYNLRVRAEEGHVVHLSVHGVRSEIDGRPAIMGVAVDVTAQERAQASREAQRKHLARIVALQQTITTFPIDEGVDELMNVVAMEAKAIIDADGAVVELMEGDELVSRGVSGTAAGELGLRMRVDNSLSGHCLRSGTLIYCPDAAADDRVDRAALRRLPIQSMLVVPLTYRGQTLGVLKVFSATRTHAFTSHHGSTLKLIAGFLAAAVSNAHAFERQAQLISERKAAMEQLEQREAHFRSLVQHASDAVAVLSADGIIMYESGSVRAMLGYEPDEMVGRHVMKLIHPDDREAAMRALETLMQDSDQPLRVTLRYRHKDGTWRTLEATGSNQLGNPAMGGIVVNSRDVTRQVETEQALRAAEAKFRGIVEQSVIGTVIIQDGHFAYVNPRMAEIFGYTVEEMMGLPALTIVHEKDQATVRENIRRRVEREVEAVMYSIRGLRKDGQMIHAELGGIGAEYAGRPAVIGTLLDVSDRVKAEQQLREREARYRLLAENMSDLVCLHAPDGTYEWVSPSVESMLGYAPRELVGLDPYTLFHPDDVERIRRESHEKVLRDEEVDTGMVYRIRHKDGRYVWFETLTDLVFDDEGAVVGLQTSSRDVTDRRAMEAKLYHQAHHDALTGLPNRVMLTTRLDEVIARSGEDAAYAVLFLDLDRFKVVNDSLGHSVGDAMLQQVAGRLNRAVRPCDTVARLGGDEFAVLIDGLTDAGAAARVAERIREVLKEPVRVEGHELVAAASIGVALGRSHHDDPDVVLREADIAMYKAKKAARGSYATYRADDHDMSARRLRLEMDLHHAAERGELRAAYQPVVRLSDGDLVGFEALVRWRHPEYGLLQPGAFIELAEETGQVAAIDRWVLREACRQMGVWSEAHAGPRVLLLNVNCSSRDLLEAGYTDYVRTVLNEQHIGAGQLLLEITETLLMQSHEAVAAELRQLQEHGVRFCIDDFGTGYSSLSTLHALPVDTIKVDRSFVARMDEDAQSRQLVQSIVHLGTILGKSVVAEGIETPGQLASLREMRCLYGQGYLFERPLPPHAASALITAPTLPWQHLWTTRPEDRPAE